MIGFSLFMWAWQVEPRRVETVTAAMEMPQWKRKEGPPLRIAIAGDFHLRPNGGDLAHKYMETIMEARPDMIFLLGDYAKRPHEGEQHGPGDGPGIFQDVESPLGIFAVQGNHMTSITAGTYGATCFPGWASCPCGMIPCCCTFPEAVSCSSLPSGTTTT
ncbi:MAG: hypothetical protein ACLT38_13325 [Akkermansia sp.]